MPTIEQRKWIQALGASEKVGLISESKGVAGVLPFTAERRQEAEAWNRGHVANVVKFDRATRGLFAKRNGELDADKVAAWQAEHRLTVNGKVDDDTVAAASGTKPPQPEPPPQPGPLPPARPSVPAKPVQMATSISAQNGRRLAETESRHGRKR
jgi:hypothetical protein